MNWPIGGHSIAIKVKVTVEVKVKVKVEVMVKDFQNSSCACEVALKGVYFQANTFGPMLKVTNLMIRPEDVSCPFESDSE